MSACDQVQYLRKQRVHEMRPSWETIMEELLKQYYTSCALCPRRCKVNRLAGQRGYCRVGTQIYYARAALHFWEEPCISASEGSGAVFFSGCSLHCKYCQNEQISGGETGRVTDTEGLADVFLDLQKLGANNINLVTACHHAPLVACSLQTAREKGLRIPVVYNSSGYELPETLRLLAGLVDVYLPDFKYMEPATAAAYSHAPDYPDVASDALSEMVRQVGDPVFSEKGLMTKGVIVRHLLLPGHVKEAKSIVKHVYTPYEDSVYLSLLSQYTPMPNVTADALLGRRVTKREYERLVQYTLELGVTNCFIQEGDCAKESFIPDWETG